MSLWFAQLVSSLVSSFSGLAHPLPVLRNNTVNAVLRWAYNSPAGDVQSAYQIQVFDYSAGTVTGGVISYPTVWDSGKVLSGKHTVVSPNSGTGSVSWTALVAGHMYRRQVKTWDTTAGGAGSPSPWSTLAPFTVTTGDAVQIVALTAGGVTATSSPATLSSNTIDNLRFTWTNQEGHAASTWQAFLFGPSGATVVDQTTLTAISPIVPYFCCCALPPAACGRLPAFHGANIILNCGFRPSIVVIIFTTYRCFIVRQ